MNKQETYLAFYGIAIIIGMYIGIRSKQSWIYYLALLLLIGPAAGLIGYAVGKEETE
jgi:lipoprotein signal peptidase